MHKNFRVNTRAVVLFDSAGFLQSLPLTGAATRTLELNRHLAEHGVGVTLLLCDLNPRSSPTCDWPLDVRYLPYADVYGDGGQLSSIVRQLKPDVLVMSNTELTVRYGRRIAVEANCALVYEMHDNEADLSRSIGADSLSVRQAAVLQTAAVKLADLVISFTERDKAAANTMGAASVAVVPCGVSRQFRSGEPGQRPTSVAFVGNLFYEPNVRAVRFLRDRMRGSLMELGGHIDVYGRFPGSLRDLGIPCITLHGPVVNLQAALATATVGVAPLDSGGGMKLKVLEYMAAGLPVVGTREAFTGIPDPHTFALVSTAKAMADFPDLVTSLVKDEATRKRLGDAGRQLALGRFSWSALAATAAHAYRETAKSRRHGSAPAVSDNARQLADRQPYWLLEWLSREEPGMHDHADAVKRHPVLAPLAKEIECARQAAESSLGLTFTSSAVPGYGGRSVVFFGSEAVLKVYTHRPIERARRELAGLAIARQRSGLNAPAVLGHDDVPGALSWVAMSKLPGTQPADAHDDGTTRLLGVLAARLHAIPAEELSGLEPFLRNVRPIATADPNAVRLERVLEQIQPAALSQCQHGFVHGDFSARNVLIGSDPDPGIIDFEGCGVGCTYEDLTNLYVHNCLIDGRDSDVILASYQDEATRLSGHREAVDIGHLLYHTARYFRWVLQWAPDVDKPLADRILNLTPAVLDAIEHHPGYLP